MEQFSIRHLTPADVLEELIAEGRAPSRVRAEAAQYLTPEWRIIAARNGRERIHMAFETEQEAMGALARIRGAGSMQ